MIVTLVTGTRPQIIKSAPLLLALQEGGVTTRFIHTGQHYDFQLAAQFIEELEIPKPDCNLEVGSGTSAYQTYEVISRLERELERERPDYLVVPGDTNSALGAALAGFKMDIPTCHLESGLRSYDMYMQEEINRRLVDHGATGLFAPTKIAVENLEKENVIGSVFLTGDTMYDILQNRLPIFSNSSYQEEEMKKVGISEGSFAVLTLHRRENVDIPDRLTGIMKGLATVSRKIVFPMHPRTKKRLEETGIQIPKNLEVVDPVPYTTMMALVSKSDLLITDSGGLQKEAYLLNTPCVTIRDNTEWVETIEAGANILALPTAEDVSTKALKMWGLKTNNDASVYGDGRAAERIAEILSSGEIQTKRSMMVE